MSVDTYLGGRKGTKGYQALNTSGVRVLVAGVLSRSATRINVTLERFLAWKSLSIEIEPIGDHLHGPA